MPFVVITGGLIAGPYHGVVRTIFHPNTKSEYGR